LVAGPVLQLSATSLTGVWEWLVIYSVTYPINNPHHSPTTQQTQAYQHLFMLSKINLLFKKSNVFFVVSSRKYSGSVKYPAPKIAGVIKIVLIRSWFFKVASIFSTWSTLVRLVATKLVIMHITIPKALISNGKSIGLPINIYLDIY